MAINGTIKRLVSDKGFGFVAAEDGSEYFSTSQRAPTRDSTTCAKARQ